MSPVRPESLPVSADPLAPAAAAASELERDRPAAASDGSETRPAAATVAVRRAVSGDAKAIAGIINNYARANLLLPRSEESIRAQIASFIVAERREEILGTVALHVYSAELAELRSLAVREEEQGLGLGRSLVDACIERARELGIVRLFALTYQITFFLRRGFTPVSKQALPEKVWTDCIHCARYYDCAEVAMILVLRPGARPVPAAPSAAR